MTNGWRDEVSPRFQPVGCEVWDRAWVGSDGEVTRGIPRERVIFKFDSPFIAREQAERLMRRMQFLDKLTYEVRQLEERLDD